MIKKRAPLWLSRQQVEDCVAARAYLSLLLPPRAAATIEGKLRKAPVILHVAKNLIRAACVTPFPKTNAKVKRDLGKIARGKPLPPIMLVRGDAASDLPLIVADGMHRLSAAWHHNESADVACCIVDRPRR